MSSKNYDEIVFSLLEKAVGRAELSLAESQSFKPFAMTLDSQFKVSVWENDIKDTHDNYTLLGEEILSDIVNIDVLVMVVDTTMPEQFGDSSAHTIRLHLEERSLADQKLSARFIFVPYSLHRKSGYDEVYVKLGTPTPVSFPAEYLLSKSK